MHVVATAGHVDHGKSTLVRALTGTDPDRLPEERRRGRSIELGYCWSELPGVGEVAFVDVPGHESFVSTMLAGIGPVPAVLLVVAADDPWMPQAAEHLTALDALGTCAGVVAVTRADLADPAPAMDRASREIAGTSLRGAPLLAVSAVTGEGMPQLRTALAQMLTTLPAPSPSADVRLWVDRAFRVSGAGVVVTGTLPAGTIRVGDQLQHSAAGVVRVRGLESLEQTREQVCGVARVALNLTGSAASSVARGSVLLAPGRWPFADTVDVRLTATRDGSPPPQRPVLHIGATRLGCHLRPLDDRHARLRLERPLPLRPGDRAILRDPGSRAVWAVHVLDPLPPPLTRRGAAARRADQLSRHPGIPDLPWEASTRGPVDASVLTMLGVDTETPAAGVLRVGGTLLTGDRARTLRGAAIELVEEHARRAPLSTGLAPSALAGALGIGADRADLVEALVEPPLCLAGGRVSLRLPGSIPPTLEAAWLRLRGELREHPFAAPTADRLRELGLDAPAIAALAGSGHLLRLAEGVVLLADADRLAVEALAGLPQPFTTSQARQAWGTSRRVALPLLALLDREGLTRRLPDDRRTLVRS